MSDSKTITSAGQLLSEVRGMMSAFPQYSYASEAVENYFSISKRVPWQIGVLRYNQLIDRVLADLEILPDGRREKYQKTLEKNCRGIVSLRGMGSAAKSALDAHFTELTIERIENFHDSLMISGRSFALEAARIDVVSQAIAELIAEIEDNPSEIDVFVRDKLSDLLNVLSRYDLFGAEGVKDYVNALIGSATAGIMEMKGPVPAQVKERLVKIIGVAKGTMDAFVYLATGVQAIEWANAHVLTFAGPAA